MKTLITLLIAISAVLGCADPLTLDESVHIQQRVLPKSYEAPTPESILDESSWNYEGSIEVDGETKLGLTNGLIAFDTQLSAGSELNLMSFSSGWTSLHIFGAEPSSSTWTQIESLGLSEPLDPEVEGSTVRFIAPFGGHYLLMIEPVMEEEADYLLRLECADGC